MGEDRQVLAGEDFDTSRLTSRQRAVLTAIRDWVVRYGYAPSSREIADAVGLASTSSVSRHLRALEELGLLRRGRTATRQLDVRMFLASETRTQRDPATVAVPLVGVIAAGSPILAEETPEETLTLPRDLVGRGTLFCLRVRGDSMIGAAICDGDVVVVRQQSEACNGDIVAATVRSSSARWSRCCAGSNEVHPSFRPPGSRRVPHRPAGRRPRRGGRRRAWRTRVRRGWTPYPG
jgi:repressor LexA